MKLITVSAVEGLTITVVNSQFSHVILLRFNFPCVKVGLELIVIEKFRTLSELKVKIGL